MAEQAVPEKYKLVMCDCPTSMTCPQGKSSTNVRCKIWAEVKEVNVKSIIIKSLSLDDVADPDCTSLVLTIQTNVGAFSQRIHFRQCVYWLKKIASHVYNHSHFG